MRCVYCDVIRKCTPNSPVQAKIWRENLRFRCDITETPNRPSLSICGVLTLRYCRGKHVSANHERAKLPKIPDHLIIYNYRLLLRSTRYHADRVWYWLTEAGGRGLPIPDKVFMVPSRPKSKVYICFIKLSGISHEIDFNHKETSMALSAVSRNRREMRCVYCDVIMKCTPNSPVWAKNWRINLRFHCDITATPNRPSLSICGVLTLRYGRGKHVSANHE